MILDSEVRSGIDDKEGSGSESDGQSNSSSLGTNSRDSPSPSGRGHGSGAQDDDSNGNDGHSSDDHSNSGHRHGPSSRGRRLGTDDSHSNRRNNNNNDNNDNDDNDNNNNHGNSGYEPRDSNHDNPARHDNDNNDDGHDPGHRAAPTPEESEAAQARLLEVYRNAQDAAIAELRQSDPVSPLYSYLTLPLDIDLKLTQASDSCAAAGIAAECYQGWWSDHPASQPAGSDLSKCCRSS